MVLVAPLAISPVEASGPSPGFRPKITKLSWPRVPHYGNADDEAVPLAKLRARTTAIARTLLEKNPTVLRQARIAFKNVQNMPWDVAADYLSAKNEQGVLIDPERGREQGLKQFLDDKSYKPGLKAYKRGK